MILTLRSNVLVFFLCLFYSMSVIGQTENAELTYKEYLENILRFHPIAKQANLQLDVGAIELLSAKGNLDPVISADWTQKNFDDKLYYRQYQAKVVIPTKLGIDITGGYENAEGIFLNPESTTDDFGLWHLGIEVNALQGLFVNERRIAFEQAAVFQRMALNEQQIALNELLYQASVAYFLWQQFHYSKMVLAENIDISATYFDNTKQAYENGEKTAMDTLEALILYQDAIAFSQKNEMLLVKSIQNVENNLWFEDLPVALQLGTVPEDFKSIFFPTAINWDNSRLADHPLILAAQNKLSYFELEQSLKREKLKPKLKIKYNPLLATNENNLLPNFSIANNRWGLDFSMPFLFRTEKADIQRGELKLKDAAFGIQNKRNEIQNKIEGSLEQQSLLQQQLIILNQNVDNYKTLLDGETEKFNYGESSVFLLNKRQEKYINGRLKLVELFIKSHIEILNYLFYSNQLIDN